MASIWPGKNLHLFKSASLMGKLCFGGEVGGGWRWGWTERMGSAQAE